MTKLSDLQTPALILDRGKLKSNIARMHDKFLPTNVTLRPHAKTAKNINIMRYVLNGQKEKITVSTLKEAEYFFENGIKDILYAVGIAPLKLDRVARLIKNGAKMTIILDSVEQASAVLEKAKELKLTFPVLIEIDCDGHRSGILESDKFLIELGHKLSFEEGVQLNGVLTHAGESYNCKTTEDICLIADQERDNALKSAEKLFKAGIPCPVVSIGSTPTATFNKDLVGITEVRSGVFMFNDLVMAGLGVCKIEQIAISVLATVIGFQKQKNWIITDCGWMALSHDRGTAKQIVDQGYGIVCNIDGIPFDNIIVKSTNQEHGILTNRENWSLNIAEFKIGSQIRILPNHACATAAMHDRYYVVDGSRDIIDIWHRINFW